MPRRPRPARHWSRRSIAWVAAGVPARLGSRAGDLSPALLEAATVTIVVAGLENAVFAMLPLRFMPGAAVYAWNRRVWVALMALGLFGFAHVLLNPSAGYLADTTRTSFLTLVAAAGRLRHRVGAVLGVLPLPAASASRQPNERSSRAADSRSMRRARRSSSCSPRPTACAAGSTRPSSSRASAASCASTLRDAQAVGKVLALDPPQHISFTWEWDVEPLGAAQRRRVRRHRSRRADARDGPPRRPADARRSSCTTRCGATGSSASRRPCARWPVSAVTATIRRNRPAGPASAGRRTPVRPAADWTTAR